MAMAMRSKSLLNLAFPSIIWKYLVRVGLVRLVPSKPGSVRALRPSLPRLCGAEVSSMCVFDTQVGAPIAMDDVRDIDVVSFQIIKDIRDMESRPGITVRRICFI